MNYGGGGSGVGVSSITNHQVDFGASDAPLTPDQADNCKGCVQVPWALAATVLAYNVRGAPSRLRLSGPVLADIFLGKVTQWNDSAIARLNPGVQLPAARPLPVATAGGWSERS